MKESEIETYFCWAVMRLGGVTYKFKSPTQRGVADRIACLPGGMTWFVELKQPKGRLSALQKEFALEMRIASQDYAVLWTKQMIDDWILDVRSVS
jgi:hypothetical protein